MTISKTINPEVWIDRHGDVLFQFALTRLGDSATAEDAVQDTFLAAWRARDDFSGQASERTWLIGILKHKIVDIIRKQARLLPTADMESPDEALDDTFFDRKGHWRVRPAVWQVHPRKLVERQEFRAVLRACLAHLPPRLSRAFTLRELDDEKTEAICKLLAITSTNLWVMLYRARMQLRACLTQNWFQSPGKGDSC